MNWYMVLLGGLGLLILAVAWLPALVRGFPLSLPIASVVLGFALFSIPGTGPDPKPCAMEIESTRPLPSIALIRSMKLRIGSREVG